MSENEELRLAIMEHHYYMIPHIMRNKPIMIRNDITL